MRAVPTYDYECRSCGNRIEVIHSMLEDGPSTCEVCGGALKRVIYPTGIIFKGSGFYKTDSRNSGSSSSGSSTTASKPAGSTETASGENGSKPAEASASRSSDGGSSGSGEAASKPSTKGSASEKSGSGAA
jgi:putative FmdB family regulatory protein